MFLFTDPIKGSPGIEPDKAYRLFEEDLKSLDPIFTG